MFREGKKGKGYIVCVVFKGKRTHHQVTEEAGKLAINGKVTEATTIKEVNPVNNYPGLGGSLPPLPHNIHTLHTLTRYFPVVGTCVLIRSSNLF